jgi:iron complex transport system ATP-binding protein
MASNQIILTATNLNLGYRKGKDVNTIAENLDFELEKGKLTCLLGPNGVGKSTLIKTILGQLPPLHGQINLDGKPIREYHQREISKKIAVVLTDKIRMGTISVRQLVELGRIPHTGWLGNLAPQDQIKVDNAIQSTNIQYLADRPLTELSDGQLQKVMIARALAQDGELLILDEPTAHLDLVNRIEIMQLLHNVAKSENKAVLVTTHDLEIAIETSDIFWLMQCNMPLIAGLPEDLIIQGALEVLLPEQNMTFDASSGKVKLIKEATTFPIEGPPTEKKWVQSALIKNGLENNQEELRIFINDSPFLITLNKNQEQKDFRDINSLLEYLTSRKIQKP